MERLEQFNAAQQIADFETAARCDAVRVEMGMKCK
jgi:hypothetical protein